MRTKNYLTSSDVQTIVAAAKAEAQKNNWNVAIAIVDDAGALLYLERMDKVAGVAAEVATGKARQAGITGRPSKFWEERLKDRPAFIAYPAGIPIHGGLPILYQGECVGGVGVSGVQSHEDEQIAKAGIDALG
jgi:glc operon protein GlcG